MNEELKTQLNTQLENHINEIVTQGIQTENIAMLGKLIDIHKDLANENYWKEKEETMRYRDYYDDDRNYPRESYGRRGRDSRGRYKGDDMIDDMHRNYRMYSDGREQYNRGNYGAKQDTMQSLEYMLESVVDFVEMLKEEAGSQEEMELIKHYTKKISEM